MPQAMVDGEIHYGRKTARRVMGNSALQVYGSRNYSRSVLDDGWQDSLMAESKNRK